MFEVETAREKAMGLVLEGIANAAFQAARNPSLTMAERMDQLVWIQKKIPEIRRLAMAIETDRINRV